MCNKRVVIAVRVLVRTRCHVAFQQDANGILKYRLQEIRDLGFLRAQRRRQLRTREVRNYARPLVGGEVTESEKFIGEWSINIFKQSYFNVFSLRTR